MPGVSLRSTFWDSPRLAAAASMAVNSSMQSTTKYPTLRSMAKSMVLIGFVVELKIGPLRGKARFRCGVNLSHRDHVNA